MRMQEDGWDPAAKDAELQPAKGGTQLRKAERQEVPGGDPVAEILRELRDLSTNMREKAFDPAASADLSRKIEVGFGEIDVARFWFWG